MKEMTRTETRSGSAIVTAPYRVALAVRAPTLRELLRTDLARNGFDVARRPAGRLFKTADIVVTDEIGPRGKLATVHLGDDVEVFTPNGTWWFPISEIDRLSGLLHAELEGSSA